MEKNRFVSVATHNLWYQMISWLGSEFITRNLHSTETILEPTLIKGKSLGEGRVENEY